METYLKCLLKCTVPFRICDAHLKPVVWLNKVSSTAATLYARFFVHCVSKRDDERKLMYQNARLFIAYDGALEGGRDQDWWLEICANRMAESIEYWSGRTPARVSYEMAHDEPLKYPNTYVYWKTWETYFKVKRHIVTHKYWIIASLIAFVI